MQKKLLIKNFFNLSKKFNCSLVEFQTNSTQEFNLKIKKICNQILYQMIQITLKKNEHNKKNFHSAINQQPLSFEHLKKSYDQINFLEEPFKEISILKNLIADCLKSYIKVMQTEYRGHSPNFIHAWTPVFKNKEVDTTAHYHHEHPMNISGVYYITGDFRPGNGDLAFYPPLRLSNKKILYEPKQGNLILFPSSIPHSIGAYRGQIARVSVAFDIWFKPDPKRHFTALG